MDRERKTLIKKESARQRGEKEIDKQRNRLNIEKERNRLRKRAKR